MTETIIELRDLSIGYGNKKVLQNINAKINKGEIVGIIGCNAVIPTDEEYMIASDTKAVLSGKMQ